MGDLVFIAAIIFTILWWLDSIRTKEIARIAGLQVCRKNSVQFLDDTVVSKRIFLRRNDGRLQICRVYQFEFCSDGADRYKGKILMKGHKVGNVTMDAYRIPREE